MANYNTKHKVVRGTRQIELPYRPMVKQQQAHRLSAKYRGFCGGWGNGKTSWGCAETFATLMEFPGTTAIVARKTRPELKSTTWEMLLHGDPGAEGAWEGIPPAAIESYNKSDLYIKLRGGSQIHGLPLDDPAKLENYNLGFFWVDQAEEIDEEIFLKFHGRLRQLKAPREGILTFNPNGHNWLWRRFLDPYRPIKWTSIYRCVEATTFDNPNLPDDYLDQFEGLPDAWVQRFVWGSHDVFVGQIFTDYDEEVHVIQPFRIPLSWERWMCIDPGIRHEGCISWVARDPDNNCYYYRELLQTNQPVSWWADRIFDYERREDLGGPDEKIFRRLIGPEARIRAQTDTKSVLDVFNECGIYPEIADRDPAARISKITTRLRPHDDHTNPFTRERPSPSLFIFDSCTKMKEYLPQYRWRPQRVTYADEDLPESPRKKDDHNVDCLGHIVVAMDKVMYPDGQSPRKTEEEQLFEDALKEAELMQARRGQVLHDILGAH